MSRTGTIVKLSGHHALVATTRRGICDGCQEASHCALDASSAGDTDQVPEELMARNPLQAKPGDRVEFDLEGHTELKLSLLVWIVPLLGLIAGAILGATFHPLLALDRDAATLLGLAAGAAVAFAIVMRIDRKVAKDERLVPVILKVLPAPLGTHGTNESANYVSTSSSCSHCPEP